MIVLTRAGHPPVLLEEKIFTHLKMTYNSIFELLYVLVILIGVMTFISGSKSPKGMLIVAFFFFPEVIKKSWTLSNSGWWKC